MPKLIIHLPTAGKPYVITNKKDCLEDYQELVAYPNKTGSFEYINAKFYVIHPMFADNCKAWRIASLLNVGETRTIINEAGAIRDYMPNMACIRLHQREGHCPHLWGEAYLIVDKKYYDAVCKKVEHTLNSCEFNEDQEEEESEEEESE